METHTAVKELFFPSSVPSSRETWAIVLLVLPVAQRCKIFTPSVEVLTAHSHENIRAVRKIVEVTCTALRRGEHTLVNQKTFFVVVFILVLVNTNSSGDRKRPPVFPLFQSSIVSYLFAAYSSYVLLLRRALSLRKKLMVSLNEKDGTTYRIENKNIETTEECFNK